MRGAVAMRSAVEAIFGERTFDQLRLLTAAVAADLVKHERVVMERGSVGLAATATVAIPSLYNAGSVWEDRVAMYLDLDDKIITFRTLPEKAQEKATKL